MKTSRKQTKSQQHRAPQSRRFLAHSAFLPAHSAPHPPTPATAAQSSRESPEALMGWCPPWLGKGSAGMAPEQGTMNRGGGLPIQRLGMRLEGPGEGKFEYVAHSNQQLRHSSSSFKAQMPNPTGRRIGPLPPPPKPRGPSLGRSSSLPPAPNEHSRWLG